MQFLRTVWTRIQELIIKLISVKGVIFIIATVLKFNGIISDLIWFAFGVCVISFRTFEKLIDKMTGNDNNG